MNDVDIIDAEIVEESMSYGDARELTDEIVSDIASLVAKVKRAWSCKAWRILGYQSWEAYCVGERVQLHLNRDERKMIVADLAEQEMSTRAIAPVVGANFNTVARDMRSVSNDTDAPRKVTGVDGVERTIPARPATTLRDAGVVDMATGEIYDPATVTPENREAVQAERGRMLGLFTDASMFSEALNRLESLSDPRRVTHYLEVARTAQDRPDFNMKHHNPESIRNIAQHLLNYATALEEQS